MQNNTIEVKQADRARKLYKPVLVWVIVSFFVSLVLIPLGVLEIVYLESCFVIFAGLLLSPLVPGLILFSINSQLKNIPVRIELYADRLRFVYMSASGRKDIDVPWGEIIEVIPHDRLRTSKRREVSLNYLKKAEMDLILYYIGAPEKLDVSDVVSLRNLDLTSRKLEEEPTEKVCIENDRATLRKQVKRGGAVLVGITLMFLASIAITWMFGGFLFLLFAGGVFFILAPLIVWALINLYPAMKARDLEIDREGARVTMKDGPLWDLDWDEIASVTSRRDQGNIRVTFKPKRGKSVSINSLEFTSDQLRSTYMIIKNYCIFHRITLIDTVGW